MGSAKRVVIDNVCDRLLGEHTFLDHFGKCRTPRVQSWATDLIELSANVQKKQTLRTTQRIDKLAKAVKTKYQGKYLMEIRSPMYRTLTASCQKCSHLYPPATRLEWSKE